MAARCVDTTKVLLPVGTVLYRQGVRLSFGLTGHVYRHEGRGEWYEVAAIRAGVWRVCVSYGASCPCGG